MNEPMNAGGAAAGLRVLLVDDNIDSTESMSMLLELSGHQVSCAHDGEAALALAREFDPQVVLLDIGLPGMDGLELARRLREAYAARLRIIALSGRSREQDRQAALQAGMDLYLVKPVDPGRIVAIIEGADH